MKKKIKIAALCLLILMQSVPSYAVVEPLKVLQYSIRTTHKTIEVVQNLMALLTSVQNTLLQGDIGAIAGKMTDLTSEADLKTFAPTVPSELKSVLSSSDAVPKIRSFIESEMENVNFDDPLAQRDALNDVAERLNIRARETYARGTEVLAKLNKAPSDNAKMLSYAKDAATQQEKETQETAFSVKAMSATEVLQQQDLLNLGTQALTIISNTRNMGIHRKNESTEQSDEDEQEDVAAEKLELLGQGGAAQ